MSERHAINFKDLTGQRFGKRVVICWHSSPIYRGKKGSSLWVVKCDCGIERLISTSNLKKNPSCGCDNDDAAKRSGKTRRLSTPQKIRNNHSHRKVFFKLLPEDFQKLIEGQNNKCKICQETFSRTPHVDHDHSCCSGPRSCGKCIRGLLCHKCNTGIGNLRDDTEVLKRAIEYLSESINA